MRGENPLFTRNHIPPPPHPRPPQHALAAALPAEVEPWSLLRELADTAAYKCLVATWPTEFSSGAGRRIDVSQLRPVRHLGSGAMGTVWSARGDPPAAQEPHQLEAEPGPDTGEGGGRRPWQQEHVPCSLCAADAATDAASSRSSSRGVGAGSGVRPDPLVAVKQSSQRELLASGQAHRAVRELRALSSLSHPFVVPLLGADADDTFVYLCLPVATGGTLHEAIARAAAPHPERAAPTAPTAARCKDGERAEGEGPKTETGAAAAAGGGIGGLPLDAARFVCACLLAALAHLHGCCGMEYRDLKSDNVLLRGDNGYPWLCDFSYAASGACSGGGMGSERAQRHPRCPSAQLVAAATAPLPQGAHPCRCRAVAAGADASPPPFHTLVQSLLHGSRAVVADDAAAAATAVATCAAAAAPVPPAGAAAGAAAAAAGPSSAPRSRTPSVVGTLSHMAPELHLGGAYAPAAAASGGGVLLCAGREQGAEAGPGGAAAASTATAAPPCRHRWCAPPAAAAPLPPHPAALGAPDMWAFGVLAFEALTGLLPFGEAEGELGEGGTVRLAQRVARGLGHLLPPGFGSPPQDPGAAAAGWGGDDGPGSPAISAALRALRASAPRALGLILACLSPDPLARPTAAEAMRGDWFAGQGDGDTGQGPAGGASENTLPPIVWGELLATATPSPLLPLLGQWRTRGGGEDPAAGDGEGDPAPWPIPPLRFGAATWLSPAAPDATPGGEGEREAGGEGGPGGSDTGTSVPPGPGGLFAEFRPPFALAR